MTKHALEMIGKKPRITQRHKTIVAKLKSGKVRTLKSALLASGYSEQVSNSPTKVTETLGFKAVMAKAGLTDDYLYNCLQEDIDAKPQHRAEELKLAGKWLGIEQNKLDIQVEYTDLPDDTFAELVKRANKRL